MTSRVSTLLLTILFVFSMVACVGSGVTAEASSIHAVTIPADADIYLKIVDEGTFINFSTNFHVYGFTVESDSVLFDHPNGDYNLTLSGGNLTISGLDIYSFTGSVHDASSTITLSMATMDKPAEVQVNSRRVTEATTLSAFTAAGFHVWYWDSDNTRLHLKAIPSSTVTFGVYWAEVHTGPPAVEQISPWQIVWAFVTGNFWAGLLNPFTLILGTWFWGLIFIVMLFSVWFKSRSIGTVLVFTTVFSGVSSAVMPNELRQVAVGILAFSIAFILLRLLMRRE